MICYACGMNVGNAKQCPSCGAKLRLFQKAIHISNGYYNDGLQKAQVRDLSGAVNSLKACLKFNKYHIDARNLLGLVYYEMGETVDALSEWVISKSYQPDENRASKYLEQIQHNQAQLNTVNQTIKKYNQALLYCKQDSRDLAIIQLKKVLSLNPKLVKGHQLLALLYLQEGKYEAAKKALRNAGKIDTNNTMTLRYLKEVNARLRESSKKQPPKQDDLISYQSGNETIIMPKRFKEYSLGGTIAYLVIGLIIGMAVTAWLIVPKVKKDALSDANQKLLVANDTISTNTQTITGLERQIDDLMEQIEDEKNSSNAVAIRISSYEKLLEAYAAYTQDDIVAAGDAIAKVDSSHLENTAKATYDTLEAAISEQYIEQLYQEGYQAYNDGKYETATESLQTVVDMDMDYDEGSAVYYLAQAYRRNGQEEIAKEYYQYVFDNYPGTKRAKTAEEYLGD